MARQNYSLSRHTLSSRQYLAVLESRVLGNLSSNSYEAEDVKVYVKFYVSLINTPSKASAASFTYFLTAFFLFSFIHFRSYILPL